VPKNIEIKAVLNDPAQVERTAIRLSGAAQPEIIQQTDVFFRSPDARLKLRIFGPDTGELIRYERADSRDARTSNYSIARTRDPQVLLEILTAALGTTGIVKKTRRLFLIGQTRVHIDEVEGLGTFLELEVVLRADQTEAEGHRIIQELLSEFGIEPAQLLAQAYVDLLRAKASGTSGG
jgi:predicted adenylyl cyclase CyaB